MSELRGLRERVGRLWEGDTTCDGTGVPVSMIDVPGSSVHVSVRAVPDDDLVSTLLLIGPLWKSGDITVWRSGACLVDLSPLLAEALGGMVE